MLRQAETDATIDSVCREHNVSKATFHRWKRKYGEMDLVYFQSIADAYLTADGRRGRLAQLHTAGTPMAMVTHWQSLFSNGRRTGLRILNEVCRRVQGSLGEQVQWTHCSELARIIAAQDSPRQVVS